MDVLSNLNEITLDDYLSEIIRVRTYNLKLMQRLKPRVKKAEFDKSDNIISPVATLFPIVGGARTESADMPTPGLHAYTQQYDTTKEVVTVAGLSRRVVERLTGNPKSLVDQVKESLDNCGLAADIIAETILYGDSTGRLAQCTTGVSGAGSTADPYVLVVNNTVMNFGWAGTAHIFPGMKIDVKTWADGTALFTGVTVIAKTATTITLGNIAVYGGTAPDPTPTTGDVIFLAGSVTYGGTGAIPGSTGSFNLPNGLLNLADDGSCGTGGPDTDHNGSWAGVTLHNLDRTAAAGAHLKSVVSKAGDWAAAAYGSDGADGTPHEWPINVLDEHIALIEDGTSGGSVSDLIMERATLQALARRAAIDINAMTLINNGEIIPGRTCPYYRFDGRKIPITIVPSWPVGEIFIADFNQLTIHEEIPQGWYDGYATKPWFESPGARNLMLEAWLRHVYQMTIKHGDAFVRLQDLLTTT